MTTVPEPHRDPPSDNQPATSTTAGRNGPNRKAAMLAIGAALALASMLLVAGLATGWWGTREPEGLVFVIPAGAKANVARPGFDSAIAIPTDIRFGPGDVPVITVRNLDDTTHRAGPFLVGAGQTYVQRFPEPGRYPIACTVDPLESVVVTVEA